MSIRPIITVGFNKHGEADFEVNSAVYNITPDQLNDLASMCFAAFHAAYGMRNSREALCDDNEKAKAQTGNTGTAGRAGKAPT